LHDILKKFCVILVGLAIMFMLTGCAEYAKWNASNGSAEYEEWTLRHKIEEQLDHERLVRDCQMYSSCKGAYKIYNGNPKKR